METPAFQRAQEQNKIAAVPVVELFRTHTKNTVLGLGARYIEGVTFNIYGVFLVGYLTSTLHMTRQSALSAVMVAAAIMIVMLPLCGKLSDRIGRRLLFGVASLVIGVLSFLAFYMMDGTSTLMTVIAVVIPFAFIYPAVYGPEAALFSELFDTRVRYSGISFVYQFSGIFASGLTPIIATALLPLNGGKPWYICLYILVVSAISAVSVYAMTDRHNSDITVDETNAEGKVVQGLQPQGG